MGKECCGRKAHPVNKCFTLVRETDTNLKMRRFRCLFCDWTTTAGATRKALHIVKQCIKVPQATRIALGGSESGSSAGTVPSQLLPPSMTENDDHPGQGSLSHEDKPLGQSSSGSGEISTFHPGPGECETVLAPSPISTVARTPTHTPAPMTISSFVTRISPQRLDTLQAMMARAIYTSGCPFRLVENEDWATFLSELNPSFKMPSRADVGGRLLDTEAEKIEQAQKARFAHGDPDIPNVSLVCDAWVNVNGDGVLNFTACDPSPMFLDVVVLRERHTAAVIAREICVQISRIGENNVVAIVTDNAANMKAAWSVVHAKVPHVLALGCTANGLNLLLEDFMTMKSLETFIIRIKVLVKTVRNKTILANAIHHEGAGKLPRLKLPVATR